MFTQFRTLASLAWISGAAASCFASSGGFTPDPAPLAAGGAGLVESVGRAAGAALAASGMEGLSSEGFGLLTDRPFLYITDLESGSHSFVPMRVKAGERYAIVAGAERGSDLDLAVATLSGERIAADFGPDLYPVVRFEAERTGVVLVALQLSEQSRGGTAAVLLHAEGGVRATATQIAGSLGGAMRALVEAASERPDAMLEAPKHGWSMTASLVPAGETVHAMVLSAEDDGLSIIAAADNPDADIDLELTRRGRRLAIDDRERHSATVDIEPTPAASVVLRNASLGEHATVLTALVREPGRPIANAAIPERLD